MYTKIFELESVKRRLERGTEGSWRPVYAPSLASSNVLGEQGEWGGRRFQEGRSSEVDGRMGLEGPEKKDEEESKNRTSQDTDKFLHIPFVPSIVYFNVLHIKIELLFQVGEYSLCIDSGVSGIQACMLWGSGIGM
jgi:hypothetical protein